MRLCVFLGLNAGVLLAGWGVAGGKSLVVWRKNRRGGYILRKTGRTVCLGQRIGLHTPNNCQNPRVDLWSLAFERRKLAEVVERYEVVRRNIVPYM